MKGRGTGWARVVGLCAIATTDVIAGGPGLQDPANPIKPAEPPPAPPPDPVVTTAGEHGLEPVNRHRGLGVTFAAGGGLTVGVGIDGSIGNGPTASLRIRHMAGERFAFVFEAANTTPLRRAGSGGRVKKNLGNNLLLGAQLYVSRALWLRLGAGIGSFTFDDGTDKEPDLTGPAGVAGGGFNILQFRRVGIGLEVMTLAMASKDGLLTTTALMFGVSVE